MSTLKNNFNEGFFERVFDIARLIPYGRVTSYGAIARFLGSGQSARMVGWAMNASHTCGDYVPAHRVVNHRGLLTGKTSLRQFDYNEAASRKRGDKGGE